MPFTNCLNDAPESEQQRLFVEKIIGASLMIIDPDFPDHWKTRMLAGYLGDDPSTPVYLIRLWGHCQMRKKNEFENFPPMAVKAVCRFAGDADAFDAALTQSGWISREDGGNSVVVLGWDEHNASLLNSWENGRKGGRPRKPKENPRDNPRDNPTETHGLTDREEKRREDKKNLSAGAPAPARESLADGFKDFWSAYPKKRDKKKSLDVWKSKKLCRKSALVVEDVQKRVKQDRQWLDGYAPNPTTYLRGERWEDEMESVSATSQAGAFEKEWQAALKASVLSSSKQREWTDNNKNLREAVRAVGGLSQLGRMTEWDRKAAKEKFIEAMETSQ